VILTYITQNSNVQPRLAQGSPDVLMYLHGSVPVSVVISPKIGENYRNITNAKRRSLLKY